MNEAAKRCLLMVVTDFSRFTNSYPILRGSNIVCGHNCSDYVIMRAMLGYNGLISNSQLSVGPNI